jgi:hypothetical protein
MLGEAMRQERSYENARRAYLAGQARRLSSGKPYPGREELHDRAGLR